MMTLILHMHINNFAFDFKDAVTKTRLRPLPKCTTAHMQQMLATLTPLMDAVLATSSQMAKLFRLMMNERQ